MSTPERWSATTEDLVSQVVLAHRIDGDGNDVDGWHWWCTCETSNPVDAREPQPRRRWADAGAAAHITHELLTTLADVGLLPSPGTRTEEWVRADERAKVSEALRRAAINMEARVTTDLGVEGVALIAGGINACRRYADLLDVVTRNGGYMEVAE